MLLTSRRLRIWDKLKFGEFFLYVTLKFKATAVFSFKKINFRHKITRFIFAWLMFVCLSVGLIPISGQERRGVGEIVFCPLQKIWVKKNSVASPKPVKLLGRVCAPIELKENFLFESSKKLFSSKMFSREGDAAEQIFFAYAAKGKRAFAEIAAPLPNSPERQFAKIAAQEKSAGGGFKKHFQPTCGAQAFLLELFARPPTVRILIKTHYGFAQKLEKISRRINPRSPPVFV